MFSYIYEVSFMGNIVLVEGSRVFTTSLVIAEGVDLQHSAVMRMIRKYEKDLNEVGTSGFKIQKFKTKGRDGELAELDEQQTTFLITLMRNSKIVIEFKKKLTKEFFRQREIIAEIAAMQKDPHWSETRNNGKLVYQQKTEVIKDFVDYATEQGSKSAGHYYSNLATMENKALFFIEQKYKNLRNILNINQLFQICTADQIVNKALQDGMEQQLHYKDVYKLAKSRVENFAEIMGKSPVSTLLTQNGETK